MGWHPNKLTHYYFCCQSIPKAETKWLLCVVEKYSSNTETLLDCWLNIPKILPANWYISRQSLSGLWFKVCVSGWLLAVCQCCRQTV